MELEKLKPDEQPLYSFFVFLFFISIVLVVVIKQKASAANGVSDGLYHTIQLDVTSRGAGSVAA